MLVTAAPVLLLLDFWPLGRLRAAPGGAAAAGARCSRSPPCSLLSAASSVVTFIAQQQGGAVSPCSRCPAAARVPTRRGIRSYLGKTLWPAGLAVFTPIPAGLPWRVSAPPRRSLPPRGARCAWRGAPRPAHRLALVPGMLLPVIGFVQVGSQFAADRYTYLPLRGSSSPLAWGAAELTAAGRGRTLAAGARPSPLLALAVVARGQVRHLADGVTLFSHAIRSPTRTGSATRPGHGAEPAWPARRGDRSLHTGLRLRPGCRRGGTTSAPRTTGAAGRRKRRPPTPRLIRLEPGMVEAYNNLGVRSRCLGRPRTGPGELP